MGMRAVQLHLTYRIWKGYTRHTHAKHTTIVRHKAGRHLCDCHPHKLNYMEPPVCERADGLRGNVWSPNVLHRVALDLICFTSGYWHITGLCHLRSLTGAGDSLAAMAADPISLMLLHNPQSLLYIFSAAGLLRPAFSWAVTQWLRPRRAATT